MQTNHADLFYAIITLGLNIGYTDQTFPIENLYDELSYIQNQQISTRNIYLSANCWTSTIILSGQREDHVNIKFINYPRFPLTEEIFKSAVVEIAHHVLKKLHQNRLVIEFHDSLVMLQENENIDPRIINPNS